jgi:hypothetical protein
LNDRPVHASSGPTTSFLRTFRTNCFIPVRSRRQNSSDSRKPARFGCTNGFWHWPVLARISRAKRASGPLSPRGRGLGRGGPGRTRRLETSLGPVPNSGPGSMPGRCPLSPTLSHKGRGGQTMPESVQAPPRPARFDPIRVGVVRWCPIGHSIRWFVRTGRRCGFDLSKRFNASNFSRWRRPSRLSA